MQEKSAKLHTQLCKNGKIKADYAKCYKR